MPELGPSHFWVIVILGTIKRICSNELKTKRMENMKKNKTKKQNKTKTTTRQIRKQTN